MCRNVLLWSCRFQFLDLDPDDFRGDTPPHPRYFCLSLGEAQSWKTSQHLRGRPCQLEYHLRDQIHLIGGLRRFPLLISQLIEWTSTPHPHVCPCRTSEQLSEPDHNHQNKLDGHFSHQKTEMFLQPTNRQS